MGNTNSRSLEPCSEQMLASLSARNRKKLNQYHFFEAAIDTPIKRNNSQSSSSSTAVTTTSSSSYYRKRSSVGSSCSFEQTISIDYEVQCGRRYMTSPTHSFYLPCDNEEIDRLVVMHFLLKYAFNGNLVAPVDSLLRSQAKVLDVGCGPGTWILEMATEYPNTEFYGVDIRLMFPTTIKPPNAKFVQHDFFENLPYPDNTFDVVCMRLVLGFLTEKQLICIIKEIHRVLKPLGYVEILDCEYQVHRPGPVCSTFLNQQLLTSLRELGIEIMPANQIGTMLMTHGNFVDIHQHRVRIPIGWGGQLGEVHGQDFQAFICSIHPNLIRAHYPLQFNELMVKAVEECIANQSHINWFVCYGQKPSTIQKCPMKTNWDSLVQDEFIDDYDE